MLVVDRNPPTVPPFRGVEFVDPRPKRLPERHREVMFLPDVHPDFADVVQFEAEELHCALAPLIDDVI